MAARAVETASYPFCMVLGYGLYFSFASFGLNIVLSVCISVTIIAGLITLHEMKLPYRLEWKPVSVDIWNDLAFTSTVQILLPVLLSLTIATAIRNSGLAPAAFWPHDLPVAVQVVAMLLLSDFFGYWLHRAFHKSAFMWRFHAVHHSPHRLYWLNVSRFHPLEKAVKYLVDTLPFAAMAVAPEVLTAFFVFYAVNGFFQHSNCRVRLGPLNYVISGPELHRWHHSELVEESDHNYGNNLIIWDVMFGTRFLPRGGNVGQLGLINRSYPMGYLRQMSTPFGRGDVLSARDTNGDAPGLGLSVRDDDLSPL